MINSVRYTSQASSVRLGPPANWLTNYRPIHHTAGIATRI
jgi:hypothetical protein